MNGWGAVWEREHKNMGQDICVVAGFVGQGGIQLHVADDQIPSVMPWAAAYAFGVVARNKYICSIGSGQSTIIHIPKRGNPVRVESGL